MSYRQAISTIHTDLYWKCICAPYVYLHIPYMYEYEYEYLPINDQIYLQKVNINLFFLSPHFCDTLILFSWPHLPAKSIHIHRFSWSMSSVLIALANADILYLWALWVDNFSSVPPSLGCGRWIKGKEESGDGGVGGRRDMNFNVHPTWTCPSSNSYSAIFQG